ncbi:methyl-accepting chemotaxis protein [Natronincola peptidivorans]|uniref:Methyl-accepting chemotaxis protein n=1 Tax=Natronincola peptidivorans TaxID=426128 RepID=A0A1I0DWF8_9FIRM|nr:methyl-accepting chemotaxis protein [Natronincola peptidivorans]SET37018.1 methyl-accepting chemotaxis protein [Natronincola peptidivorans]
MKKIGTKLIVIFSGLLLVVSAALGGIAYQTSANALLQEVERALPEKAYDAGKLVERSIQANIDVLDTMTKNTDIISMDWDTQLSLIQGEINRLEFALMGVAATNGSLRLNDGTETHIGDRGYFQEALTGKSNVSEVLVNRADNSISIIFASPIYNENARIIGVLVGITDDTFLSRITNDITFGETGYAYMIDGEGTIIAHRDRDLIINQINFIEEAKTNEEYIALAALLSGTIEDRINVGEYHFRGNNIYMGTSSVVGTNWYIAVGSFRDEALAGLSELQRAFILSTIIILAIGILLVFLVSRALVQPITSIATAAKEIASLDISNNLSKKLLQRKDEIGILATAFQSVVESMRQTITSVAESSQQVAASSQQLTSTSQQSASAAEHVAISAGEVAENMNHQLNEVINTTSVISEISASMEEVSSNMQEINQMSNDTLQQANIGKDEIHKVNLQMSQINDSTDKVKGALLDITSSSDKMNEIVRLIRGIAEQTNLLALNAAIEAARAGEQGRGFAVVAEEVRKLAEESQRATQDINQLIQENQTSIQDANLIMNENAKTVEEGISIVESTEKTFDSIANLINQVNNQMEGISAAVQEVAKGSQDMVTSANAIENTTKTVASEIQNVSAATEEQTASMQEIASSTEALADLAERLQQEIQKFKL